jgi:RHS repeat-associated protein
VDHPAVTGGLKLSYGADGSAGLDALGRVVDQKWTTGDGETGTTVDEFTYGYDLSGNRTWRNVVPAESPYDVHDETYAYDCLDRLTEVRRGTVEGETIEEAGYAQSWILDAVGNWDNFRTDPDGAGSKEEATEVREHDAANQITSLSGGITPAYDAAGNMVSGPKPGSARGDGQAGQSYTYDAWNRLVKVEEWIWTDSNEDGEFQTGERSTAVPVAEYQYDGLNRRIAKLVYDAPSETWTRSDFYYNEDWQVLEERVAAAVLAADKSVPATAPKVQYLWDPSYIDTPVCRWRDADPNVAGLEEVVYYTTDANHNVTAVIQQVDDDEDPETPDVPQVAERYVYDAYGTVTVLNPDWSPRTVNSSALGNEVLFTGHPLDGETGLYYARARYLQPTLGVWLNPDPEGYTDGMNVYEYCTSNPMTASDPSGLFGIFTYDESYRSTENGVHGTMIYTYWRCTSTVATRTFIPDPNRRELGGVNMSTGFEATTDVIRNLQGRSAPSAPFQQGVGHTVSGMELALNLNPIESTRQAIQGTGIYGEQLDFADRSLAAAALVPVGKVGKVLKCGEKLLRDASTAEKAARGIKTVEGANDLGRMGRVGAGGLRAAAKVPIGLVNARSWQEYERAIRAIYGEASLSVRRYSTVVDGELVEGVADAVTLGGKRVAVEAKFCEAWGTSLRNPSSAIGKMGFAEAEQQQVVRQARAYSKAFDDVIYHSNSAELVAYYSKVFSDFGLKNVKFVHTP